MARALSLSGANTKDAVRLAHRHAAIPLQLKALIAIAPVRSVTRSIDAPPVTDGLTLPPRVLGVSFAALRHRFRVERQFARVGVVAGLNHRLFPLSPAFVVTRGMP